MDASQQLILVLTQQNLKLLEEVAELKAQLAKTNVSAPSSKAKKTTKKASATDPEKPKNPAHVETGKRLALWNANKKSTKQAFAAWKSALPEN
jgi:hypothetical protein